MERAKPTTTRPLDGLHWLTGRDLVFSPAHKHEPEFPQECPLLLHGYDLSPERRLTPNYHDYLEVGYIFGGAGVLRVEERDYSVAKGDVFVLNNREFHTIDADPGQMLRVVVIYFMPQLIYQPGLSSTNIDYLAPYHNRPRDFSNNIPAATGLGRTVLRHMDRIHREIAAHADYYGLAVGNSLRETLLAVARHYGARAEPTRGRGRRGADVERLDPVIDMIWKHYDRRITVEELARAACMSPSYLTRFFKRITGTTLSGYIMRHRVDKAKELLLEGRVSVAQVAYATGFESHSYFDRTFRKFVHMSPGEFRRRYAQRRG